MPYNRLSFLKRARVPLVLFALVYGLLLGSCGQIKYVPVKGETVVEYRDSIVTKLDTVTVMLKETEKVRDYTGMLDTLELETKAAKARAWLDTAANTLKGTLEDKPVTLNVVVPSHEQYHQKDSIQIQEVPVEVPVEKIVEVVPKFWRVTGIIGIILSILVLLYLFIKLKSSGIFTNIGLMISKIFKK